MPPRSQAGRITAFMRETAQPFLHGQDITICSYRYIAIAIAKKYLVSQATPADWRIATAALSNILAAQADHYSHINEQVYAVDVSQPFGLTPGRIEQFAVRQHIEHHTSHALLSAADRQTIQSLAVQSPLDVWYRLLAQEPPIAPFPRLPQWEALPCQYIFRMQRAAGEMSADQGPPQQADHPGTRYPGCGIFVARPQESTTALSQQ
ncbi:telomere-associated recQ-like helicase [Aspergillus affinis]|uniref:telomere-associated recQ-like helicase n=1 Tax=Aspergillus affinis TaxID=1070780 RepID=UPI0022FE54B3|nr:telomere-associated recQ-like helicase [Aspergillus affinis]KAI9035125.1 telomere-associated recQ-like helicase [Aspergillus affinis]